MHDREWLLAQARAGKQIRYLFFYGHRPSPDGSVTASCFSQWWRSSFVVDELGYATAEHYMMAQKARLFGDEEMLAKIITASEPAQAKKLGRRVRGFDQLTWERNRFDLVVAGNLAKFSQHDDLREFLLSTGNQVLVEASPRDRIWGIGMSAANEKASDPQQWRGLNLLGFALMTVRTQLSG